MSIKRRAFSSEFKSRVALEAIKGELTINEISTKYEVHSTQIARWKQQALENIKDGFVEGTKKETQDERLTEKLYQQIGQMKVEI
ncbi:MAG: transposase, partial [Gammaproteobacteria bacterium GWF2_41_13]